MPTPRPIRPPDAKVVVRNLRDGVVEPASGTHHVSIRLDPNDRRLLRELAARRRALDGIPHTMSSVARSLIREAASREGIK